MGKINLLGQRFGRLEVIDEAPSRKGQAYWLCKCDCGTIKEIRGAHLRNGSIVSCGCKGKEILNKPIDLLNQKFGKLTVIESIGQTKNRGNLWKCQCDCGNTTIASTAELRNNIRKSCGCINRDRFKELGQQNAIDITNQKFGKLTALYPTEKRVHTNVVWVCKCDCGNFYETQATLLINGIVKSCGCAKRRSFGEIKIEQLLKENNISFEQEYRFKDCVNIRTLPFDFYVNNQYLIEFDGEQHYHGGNGYNTIERVQQIQQRDEIKNDYCKEHNIPLIRIPYTQYKNLTIDDLKLETSKFLI